jgi:hypothetical protein
MKRLVAGLALVVVIVVAYRQYTSSRPAAIYQQFAEELLHRRYDAAAVFSDTLTAADLAKLGTQERIGPGPQQMFQTLFPSRFRIVSNERGADGTVTLNAVQTVLFNPEGVESAVRPAMYADMKQLVTMKKGATGWKVAAFTNELQHMDSLSAR